MSTELHVDDGAARLPGDAGPAADAMDTRRHPNVAGDLAAVLQAAPMFRRAVIGYDRFQVDTYVRWAEDELAAADREREHLVARHFRTRTALEEARRLLAHSAGGGEFLRVSGRIGSMLAAAADEAEGMRAEAAADRSAASAQSERLLAQAGAEAERLLTEAATDAAEMAAAAGRMVAEAERTESEAREEAEARLAKVRMIEQRAADRAALVRRQAAEQAVTARLQARDEVVRMLGTGRDQRRRADAEAAAARERRDREAAIRHASLLEDVAALEHRRATLRAEVERLAGQVAGRRDVHVHHLVERLRWRPRSLRAR